MFVLIASVGLSQSTKNFLLDVQSPCAGEWFTLSLPLDCSFQRLVRSQLVISPSPDATLDVVDHTSGHEGVIAVKILYKTYQSATIDVHGPYTCSGIVSGTATKTLRMSSPVTATPTISGIPDRVYSGDVVTVTASDDQVAYEWQLTRLSAVSGSVTSSAIASPHSRETKIAWPTNFVGEVELKVIVSRCSSSRETKRRISILTPPDPFLTESSVVPAVHCAGSVVRYRLQLLNNSFSFTRASLIASGSVEISVFSTLKGVPVEWSVRWKSSGSLKVDYQVSDGIRTWTGITATKAFDVAQFDAGKIHPITPGIYCAPYTISLTLDNNPVGDYVWQYCNTGTCLIDSPGWITNSPPTSQTFASVSKNTSFRTKLTQEACGLFSSTPVLLSVKQSPKVVAEDKIIFSGGTFDIPASNVPFATISVSVDTTGIRGASGFTITQGPSPGGIIATDTLITSRPLDGRVVYKIKAANGICSNTTLATVTVYKKPAVSTDRFFVYKNVKATLITDVYDSYKWKTSDDRLLSTAASYQTSKPGRYKVQVTKSNLLAESDVITIGDQFEGVNGNFIVTRQPNVKIKSDVDFGTRTESDLAESVQYFDGLGRPQQTISTRLSPMHRDLVQPVSYDLFGREVKKYLPYVSMEDNGRIKHDVTNQQLQFYQESDCHPFSEAVFEKAPLNRVIKQGSAGDAWQPNKDLKLEHVISHEYLLNTIADSIINVNHHVLYPPGVLYRNKTIDENGNEMLEFIDKLERVICRKLKVSSQLYASTYYIYDDIGNLVLVIPPEGVRSLSLIR